MSWSATRIDIAATVRHRLTDATKCPVHGHLTGSPLALLGSGDLGGRVILQASMYPSSLCLPSQEGLP